MKTGDLVGGKYRLVQRLGIGGMGAVWEAVNERTSRKVALKLILDPTPDHRQRLLREARACGSIEHRNIVEIYDVGETETGDPFLVMQLLTGETLGALIRRRRRLEPTFAVRIACDIAAALATAHDAKVIHRDLKPANIFLQREPGAPEDDFVLKVLDFGVSKDRKNVEPNLTVTNMMVGSPGYMSPEQILIDKDIDGRSDLWSLGVLLFEMLTGARPFVDKSMDIIEQVLCAPIPPVSSQVRHVPPELDAIVARCLERDLTRRYQDARELGRALGAFITETSQRLRVTGNMAATAPSSGPMRPALGSAPEYRLPSHPSSHPSMHAAGFSPPAPPAATSTAQPSPSAPGIGALGATQPLDNSARSPAAVNPWGAPTRVPSTSSPSLPAEAGAASTQVLSPAAPVPSWRREMQKALVDRGTAASSASPPGPAAIEELPHGGTVALPPEAFGRARGPSGRDVTVTTNAPLVQGSTPRDLAGRASHSGRAPAARARSVAALIAVLGGGGVLAIAGITVLVWQMRAPAVPSPAVQASLSASTEAPIAPPVKPAPVVLPIETSAPAPSEPLPEPVKSAPMVALPAPTLVPTAVVSARASAPVGTAPASKPALPKCGKFLHENCVQAPSPEASLLDKRL